MKLPPGLRERLEAHAPEPRDQPLLLALLIQPPACRRGPFVAGWSGPDLPTLRAQRHPIPGLRRK